MSDFERDLQDQLGIELHRIIDPMTAGPIPARRAPALSGGSLKKLLGGAGAAFGVKIATGFAVAALAATAAVAATEVAITGSINPANWGQQVKEEVSDCKANTVPLGAGQCTSSVARQHGDAVSNSHKDSGSDKGNTKDKDTTKGPNTTQGADNNNGGQGSDKSQTSQPGTSKTIGSSQQDRAR